MSKYITYFECPISMLQCPTILPNLNVQSPESLMFYIEYLSMIFDFETPMSNVQYPSRIIVLNRSTV